MANIDLTPYLSDIAFFFFKSCFSQMFSTRQLLLLKSGLLSCCLSSMSLSSSARVGCNSQCFLHILDHSNLRLDCVRVCEDFVWLKREPRRCTCAAATDDEKEDENEPKVSFCNRVHCSRVSQVREIPLSRNEFCFLSVEVSLKVSNSISASDLLRSAF